MARAAGRKITVSSWYGKLLDAAKLTVNFLNIQTPKKFVVITLKFEMWLYHRVMCPNDADRIANSVDPDQTAPLGAVWSGSALFAQACLSEYLGSLQYCK